jgi:Ca2+-binding EF-hand superfamily protein
MKTSMKMALATGALGVAGALFLVGSSYAERGFGARFGMMHGPGHGGLMVHEMLAEVDANSDGALSQEEIDAAVDARFTKFDANTDGSLSLEEFQALWADITKPLSVRAFQFLDPNGDAAIAKSELADRFGKAVARFDRNDDGVIDEDDHPRRGWRGHGPRWMGGERPQDDE